MATPTTPWTGWTARPRWSHRDPVEGGNPFPSGDPRHEPWRAATGNALASLAQLDARLDAEARAGGVQRPYAARVVDLAVQRFDTWARRGLAGVGRPGAEPGYTDWLRRYADNWPGYVCDTCPALDVKSELTRRLTSRVTHWARAASSRPRPSPGRPAT